MQITKLQQIVIEEETTLEDFFSTRKLNSSLYFATRNGIALQDPKTVLGINDVVKIIPLLLIIRNLLLDDDDEQPDKKLIKQLENEIPNVNDLEKIPCALCGKNVDRPYNLIKHLGVDQTKQYLSFCNETKTEPTLYCCSCYAMVEKNPNWQKAMDNMIDDSIRYGELKRINLMKIQEKESCQ